MNLTIRVANDITILQIEGNLDTNTSDEVQKKLKEIITNDSLKIIIDCGKMDYISSAGLRVLLATAKQLTGENGDLRICSLNETVSEVFEISGFDQILKVFPTEQEALSDF